MFRINGEACAASLARIRAELPPLVQQAIGQAAAFAAERARATTAFKDQTGKLRASIIRGQRSQPFAYFVKAEASYAGFVEEGTRPHVIEPRRKTVLRFISAGNFRFAKRVYHPGTKPTHFMLDARNAAEQQLVRFVEAGVSRAVEG